MTRPPPSRGQPPVPTSLVGVPLYFRPHPPRPITSHESWGHPFGSGGRGGPESVYPFDSRVFLPGLYTRGNRGPPDLYPGRVEPSLRLPVRGSPTPRVFSGPERGVLESRDHLHHSFPSGRDTRGGLSRRRPHPRWAPESSGGTSRPSTVLGVWGPGTRSRTSRDRV